MMQQTLRKSLIGAAAAGLAVACFSLVSWALPRGGYAGAGSYDPDQVVERPASALESNELQREMDEIHEWRAEQRAQRMSYTGYIAGQSAGEPVEI